jgi:hypothetical protein
MSGVILDKNFILFSENIDHDLAIYESLNDDSLWDHIEPGPDSMEINYDNS